VVHQILSFEGYIGTLYYDKRKANGKTRRVDRPREEWIAVEIPAIIAADDFQAAHAQPARNKALDQRNRKYDYLFIGGRLRCGRCGRAVTGEAPYYPGPWPRPLRR
jgi:site-specific DNA recombinase